MAIMQNREVALKQVFLKYYSELQFGPRLVAAINRMAAHPRWSLRGVPLNYLHNHTLHE